MPAPTLHAFHKEMSPPLDRLYMCWLNRPLEPNIEVSPYEIVHNLDGSTLVLMNSLQSDPYFRHFEFKYVIGMDNANVMDRWTSHKELIARVPFIVVPRQGKQPEGDSWYLRGHHELLDVKIPDISSSRIRALLDVPELTDPPVSRMLHPAVYFYIKSKKLYQSFPENKRE